MIALTFGLCILFFGLTMLMFLDDDPGIAILLLIGSAVSFWLLVNEVTAGELAWKGAGLLVRITPV